MDGKLNKSDYKNYMIFLTGKVQNKTFITGIIVYFWLHNEMKNSIVYNPASINSFIHFNGWYH